MGKYETIQIAIKTKNSYTVQIDLLYCVSLKRKVSTPHINLYDGTKLTCKVHEDDK